MRLVRSLGLRLAPLLVGVALASSAAAQADTPLAGEPAPADSAVVWSPAPGVVVVVADSAALAAFATPAPEPQGRFFAAGVASYYGERFRGRRTASGQRFNPDAMTAAHRTLPFGTRLRVTCAQSGRSVVVRVNDRGPYAHGRILDLSKAAARRIGMVQRGTGRVRIERL